MRLLTRKTWQDGRTTWNEALATYRHHWTTIFDRVPSTLREFELLQSRHDFHDEPLIGFHRLASDRATIHLGRYWVELYDIQSCRFEPENGEPHGVWLIHEIDLAATGQFRLMVLFETAELDLVAGTIHVWSKHEHRLLVPGNLTSTDASKPKRHR